MTSARRSTCRRASRRCAARFWACIGESCRCRCAPSSARPGALSSDSCRRTAAARARSSRSRRSSSHPRTRRAGSTRTRAPFSSTTASTDGSSQSSTPRRSPRSAPRRSPGSRRRSWRAGTRGGSPSSGRAFRAGRTPSRCAPSSRTPSCASGASACPMPRHWQAKRGPTPRGRSATCWTAPTSSAPVPRRASRSSDASGSRPERT